MNTYLPLEKMSNKIFYIANFLLIIKFSVLNAQTKLDLIDVNYGFTPAVTNSSAKVVFTSVDLKAPIPLKDSLFFITGINYAQHDVQLGKYSSNLYSISIPTGFRKIIGNHTLDGFLINRIQTDFGKITGNHFAQAIAGLFSYRANNGNIVKAGLLVSRERLGYHFVPLLGLEINLTEKLKANILIPQQINVSIKGIASRINGIQFNTKLASYTASLQTNSPMVEQRRSEAVVYHERPINSSFRLRLYFGYQFIHRYNFYETNSTHIAISGFYFNRPENEKISISANTIHFGLVVVYTHVKESEKERKNRRKSKQEKDESAMNL